MKYFILVSLISISTSFAGYQSVDCYMSKYDKETKKSKEVKSVGVCRLGSFNHSKGPVKSSFTIDSCIMESKDGAFRFDVEKIGQNRVVVLAGFSHEDKSGSRQIVFDAIDGKFPYASLAEKLIDTDEFTYYFSCGSHFRFGRKQVRLRL